MGKIRGSVGSGLTPLVPSREAVGVDATPSRVQLSRAKGWRMPPDTVKVDRSTQWGNPFSVQAAIDYGFAGEATGAAFVVSCFREWIGGGPNANRMWMGPQSDAARRPFRDLSHLRGKNLACWCKPGASCHADVLLELANAPEGVAITPDDAREARQAKPAGDRTQDLDLAPNPTGEPEQ